MVEAVAPKPVNVLIGGPVGLSVADLADLGVRRISVGGALARVAWGGFMRAAREISEQGTFEALGESSVSAGLDGFFTGTRKTRDGIVSWTARPLPTVARRRWRAGTRGSTVLRSRPMRPAS